MEIITITKGCLLLAAIGTAMLVVHFGIANCFEYAAIQLLRAARCLRRWRASREEWQASALREVTEIR